MVRVLLVGKGPPERGGIPTFLQTLLDGPLARQHRLHLLNLARADAPEGGRASWANARRTVQDAVAVWRAAPDHDVVHVHSALAPGVTLLRAGALAVAARARGRAVVVHAHGGLLLLWLHGRRRRLLLRLALAPASRVLVVSSALLDSLGAVGWTPPVALVDNGVDTERFHGPVGAHSPPRVLYVGLLTARKGVLDLLAASRLLTERQVPHELWLVGGVPEQGPAAVAVTDAAHAAGARVVGERPPQDLPDLYRTADLLCLPSWWEAMPLSVLEGLATGLPVVASDVGDVARVVQQGVTGALVPVRDPVALADALAALLEDPEGRARQGRAGRELVAARFSSRATADALDRTYRELAGGGP